MASPLEELLTTLRRDKTLHLDVEEATRQGIVLPILARLGWDRDNVREVVPEFPVGTGKVDYCLKIGQKKAVFIEVKRVSEPLENPDHQEQLLEYAFRDGVEIAALTNGLVWWLYLPLTKGSWEQRKFFTIDIQQQEIQAAARHFTDFLGRQEVATGRAHERAQSILASKEKERVVRETIPLGWDRLCEGPDEGLLELFSAKVESLCGHRPDVELLAEYLAKPGSALDTVPLKRRKQATQVPAGHPQAKRPRGKYTNTRPLAFSFRQQRFPVATFREILLGVAKLMHDMHPNEFERVLNLRGTKRIYFSRDNRSMTLPVQVPGTDIYAETHMDSNRLVELSGDVLETLGYRRDELIVEAEDR